MNIHWDAKTYQKEFHFVSGYGEDVLTLIDAAPSSLVVDLGCGNGALTRALQQKGYRVLGIDASEAMIRTARENHPDLSFQVADILDFSLPEQADVIFSNAVLHWIDAGQQQDMLHNIARNLRSGGVFAFEFGGFGCAERVHHTLEQVFGEYGLVYPRTFYFPTIGMYAPMLEQAGFQVQYATLFDRMTPLNGADGLADWIRMFIKKPFESIHPDQAEAILKETVRRLQQPLLLDGVWYVDYVRIRMKAVKLPVSARP